MSNAMMLFQNEEFGEIRVVEVGGEIRFVAKDVCDILDITWSGSKTLAKIPDKHKGVVNFTTPGGGQDLLCISESGLYRLVMRSSKPEAEAFQDWIADEVLPSIRKTGSYSVQPQVPQTFADALRLAAQLEDEKAALAAKIEEDEPKVSRTEFVEESEVCILVGTLAKIIKQNGIDMGQNRLFGWLRDRGLLCHKGSRKNTPTQKAMDMGLFRVVEGTRKDSEGEEVPTYTSYITGKGQTYIIHALKKELSAKAEFSQGFILDHANAEED